MKKYSDLTLNHIIAFGDTIDELNTRTQAFLDLDHEYWELFTFDCAEGAANILSRMLNSLDSNANDILRLAKDIVKLLEG